MVLAHLMLERVAQLPLAEDDEPRVRNLAHDEVGGFDQIPLPLVADERRHVADDGSAVGEEERFVDVDGRCRDDAIDVDAFVHGDRSILRHAVGHQHLSNRFRGGDVTVHLPVLPLRERIATQVKVDAARGDQRRRRPVGAPECRRVDRQRKRRHRDSVRVVRVDHVRVEPPDDAREAPGRREVHFGAGGERNELEPLLRAPPQLAVRVRDQRGAVADLAQTVDGQQHLVLTAAPGAGGVYM